MVTDGKTIRISDLAVVKFEGERIYIPAHLMGAAGLNGSAEIERWLLVVTPGRYRLLPKSVAVGEGNFSRVLRQTQTVGALGDVLDWTENNEQAGIRARLIDCTISPPEPGWRINFPKAARQLVPEKEDRSFVFMFSVAGYIEIWFPETLRRAVSVPISEVLP
jgi:hypothetical protein